MLTWEAHTCLPLHPQSHFGPLEEYLACGVNYVSINIGMDMNPLAQILPVIAAFRARIAAHPDRYVLPRSVADIERAASEGKLAVGFDLEGAVPLLEQPDMVALYRDLGVRQMHFAYNLNNSVADGCHDTERGLTALGKRMVQAVNQAGVLMDCSHTGRRCTLDIMDASAQPVIFSHANPLSLVEHGRNVSDEQIRRCAATGGVVCVSGVSMFLGTRTPDAADVARHAAYVADLVGVQHAGIGLDVSFAQPGIDETPPGNFDPNHWWPPSAGYKRGIQPTVYPPISSWRLLSHALQQTGMSGDEAALVMGGNMQRVARQVWGG
jgi:membrane dipeptidase